MGTREMVELAGGGTVPKSCVDALDKFDAEVWPGATFSRARAAVVQVVLNDLGFCTNCDAGETMPCTNCGAGL